MTGWIGGTTEAISLKTGDYFVVRSSLLVMTARVSRIVDSHKIKVDNFNSHLSGIFAGCLVVAAAMAS